MFVVHATVKYFNLRLKGVPENVGRHGINKRSSFFVNDEEARAFMLLNSGVNGLKHLSSSMTKRLSKLNCLFLSVYKNTLAYFAVSNVTKEKSNNDNTRCRNCVNFFLCHSLYQLNKLVLFSTKPFQLSICKYSRVLPLPIA